MRSVWSFVGSGPWLGNGHDERKLAVLYCTPILHTLLYMQVPIADVLYILNEYDEGVSQDTFAHQGFLGSLFYVRMFTSSKYWRVY
jgi:hypothetical protein